MGGVRGSAGSSPDFSEDLALPIQANRLTGVILAGGKSSRFGSDKAELFLPKILRRMRGIFPEVVIITNAPEKFRRCAVPLLTDEVPFQGPAGGILTALKLLKTDLFVVACDLPRLSAEVILNLLEKDDGSAFVVYQGEKGIEPLCAIYRASLLPLLESRFKAGRLDLHSLVEESGISTKIIPISPPLQEALRNVNRSEELENSSK